MASRRRPVCGVGVVASRRIRSSLASRRRSICGVVAFRRIRGVCLVGAIVGQAEAAHVLETVGAILVAVLVVVHVGCVAAQAVVFEAHTHTLVAVGSTWGGRVRVVV